MKSNKTLLTTLLSMGLLASAGVAWSFLRISHAGS